MPTLKTFLWMGVVLLTATSLVHAQAEAQKAYQDAKTAYQAGNFADARDLAEKAAQTDPKNPEVFLLLGQARYQLGQVDEAVAAWKQTLALAPKQAFAARMLEVLQAQRVGVDVRIAFVEMLLTEKLFDPAMLEVKILLSDKAISDLQRAKLLLLQAESFLGLGKPLDAEKSIREVMALYPQQADPLQISLLLGRAKIEIGGQAVGEGLMLLKKLVAEHPDAPVAISARYELLIYDLKQDVTAEKANALAKWIGENAKHARANDARRLLVEFYLKLFKQEAWNEYASRTSPDWWHLRVSLSRLLAYDLLLPDDPVWPDVMRHHAELLSAYAKFQFEENRKAGSAAANENISDIQNDLLDALHKRIARDAAYAPAARAFLREHLAPWTENHLWAVVDQMYADLASFMSDPQRRRTEIALASIWVQRAFDEHERLLKAGLTVPQRLDPLHEKALKRLYELQAELDPQSPEMKEIRDVLNAVIAHYAKLLEYDDVAQAAIGIKAEKSVPAADEFAAFQTAQLQNDWADRQFSRLAKQYGTTDKITMTPGYENALAAWMKFITDHQAGPLTAQATLRIFAVGQVYERHQAYDVAADVYGKLAKFAAGVKSLSQATPNAPTTLERAEFARAAALDSQARKLLQKAMAQRKDKSAAPDKISPEFSAAIAAYKDFIGNYNGSPLVGEAIAKIMPVGVEYARLDAWEAAESVYADLLDAKLNIRRPERLQFARGLCQLGPAMPDHAREILSALSLIDAKESKESLELGGKMDVAVNRGRSARGGGASAAGAGGDKKDSLPLANSSPPSAATPINPIGSESMASHSEKQAEAGREAQLLAMIQNQESDRARQVAQIRDNPARFGANQPAGPQEVQMPAHGIQSASQPAISEQELARQEKSLAAAYEIFQSICKKYPDTPTALQSRAEIMIMAGHLRGLSQWLKAAELTARFLTDNPSDAQLPKLRIEIARDRLAWAAKPLDRKSTRQELLAEVASRFAAAREEFAKIIAEFPKEQTVVEDAQWEIATSFLAEARVIDSVSPTLARGQYVRTAKELAQVALKYPEHPRIGSVGQMLWDIAAELSARAYDEDAIAVWEELLRYDPLNARAQESAMQIAQTYQHKLKRPLRAAEVYQELNFIRGGNDQGLQNSIFQIGSELKDQKRWVEALNVLETFADSFPRHPQAGQALTMAGQIHQANEAWADAIAAYRRVIDEFRDGQWVQDAKWSIAECTINLSQWPEAMAAYRSFVAAYPGDGKVAEANRRIEILKDLVRYQVLVDEKGQRKAFDAQFQIANIVKTQLNNPVKAIIEYRKVTANWPESYLAAEALYAVGDTYMSLNETAKARDALYKVAQRYPESPLADDALYLVGKSYEDEADKLATITREQSLEKAKDVAQRGAYDAVQSQRRLQQDINEKAVASLKSAGKSMSAELEEARNSSNYYQFNAANVELFSQKAEQQVESLTATQLADRQDKINAALRKAVEAYTAASKVPGADKAGDALLQMATIYDKRLKDSKAAVQTWLEIVRQFSGTNVAEDASWKIAQFDEREGKFADAIEAYQAFLRNYRRSPNAGPAQFAIAENYEHLGQWVNAMDAYTKYITSFPDGPMVNKAKEQINWIKTYRL